MKEEIRVIRKSHCGYAQWLSTLPYISSFNFENVSRPLNEVSTLEWWLV
jgi:hypothetical protein